MDFGGRTGGRRGGQHRLNDMATPMMEQYRALKAQHPDAILFFRLGDFYEMFEEDAEEMSRVLDLVLTSRESGSRGRIPMCGVPHHAADGYIATLVRQGYKVAICEQLQDPREAKGLVERGVVRIVTPGTVIEEASLDAGANNYLAAVTRGKAGYGLAYADVSTGDFSVTELTGEDAQTQLLAEMARLTPAECLLGPGIATDESLQKALAEHAALCSPYDERAFLPDGAERLLLEQFDVHSLEGFGCAAMPLAVQAAGAVVHYLRATQKSAAAPLTGLTTYFVGEHMVLDEATRRTLELTRTLREGGRRGTLLWVLDETKTAPGARLLRRRLEQPLLRGEAIDRRLDEMEAFVEDGTLRARVRERLHNMADIERLVGRVTYKTAGPRDLVALRTALEQVPGLKQLLATAGAPALHRLAEGLDALPDIADAIARALVDDPPVSAREGGLLRDGFDEEVDKLRRAGREGKQWIAALEQSERERTGIRSLKVGFNKVFGYYIEVTRPNLHLVPDDYVRKQTLANAERYITPELKEQEALILGAEDRVVALEYDAFCRLRDRIAARGPDVLGTARHVARLDVAAALAEAAVRRRWVRPELDDGRTLHIEAGRHPVIEALDDDGGFVPNDLRLDADEEQLLILTGPNMAGKSTYLRQTALIVLLAQMGSYVPAAKARIGLVDRIFTRIGAADDLGTGQSTFMVEMNEAANILRHATPRSLLVIDELGRGTSTYDGMAITQAIAEYIHDQTGARALLSTHYHELTRLPDHLPRARNYRTEVAEHRGRIRFLYTVVPGGADRSYGVNVARMAGIPGPVVRRARQLLQQLEAGKPRMAQLDLFGGATAEAAAAADDADVVPVTEADDFGLHLVEDEIIAHVRRVDVPRLTPLEALNLLARWQAKLTGAEEAQDE